jgi:mRNA interferase MazF
MKRGDFFRVYQGSKYDPKDYRVFVIVSRQALIDTQFSTVICAPVYSNYNEDMPTQVEVGVDEGLKHDSAIYCDDLISIPKSILTNYIGSLSQEKMRSVNNALRVALAIEG